MSTTNTPDVEIVFGVDGHTAGGASYNLIAKQLQALSKSLAKNKIPLVKIGVDKTAFDKQIKSIKDQLKKLSTKISIPVDLSDTSKRKQNNNSTKQLSPDTITEEEQAKIIKEQEENYAKLNTQLEKCLKLQKDVYKTRSVTGDKYAEKVKEAAEAWDNYNAALTQANISEEQRSSLSKNRKTGEMENSWIVSDELVKNEGQFAKLVDKVRSLQNQIVGTKAKGAEAIKTLEALAETQVKLTDENGEPLSEEQQLTNYREAVEKLANAYNKCKTEAAQYGLTVKTSWDRLQELVGSKILDKIAQALVALGVRALNQVYQNVVKLDKALVNLQIATGYTREQTKKLIKEYGELATQIGATVTEVADAADTWLRQGYSVAETNELITSTMMLSKLGQLDSAEAAKALTSAMKGYKKEVSDCISIVDKFTAVDMSAAINAGDIATAMAETATSADVAGVSMDSLIGYIATVGEVTQDGAESVGGFFKTLFARMGNIKTGVFTDDETGESLNDVEKTLSKLGVSLRDSKGLFRDFDDVLTDVANNWENYDNVQQHAIATAMAGTRQQEKFITLMSNYGTAMEYATVAAESSGTATKKYADYMDSIEAKLNNLTASWETFSNTILDSELVKGGVDFLTSIVDILDKIANAADGFLVEIPMIYAGVAAIITLTQKMGKSSLFANMISPMKNVIKLIKEHTAAKTVEAAASVADAGAKALDTAATTANTAAEMGTVASTGAGAVAKSAEAVATTADAGAKAADTVATEANTVATNKNTEANIANNASNPLGWIILAITAVITIIELIKKLNDKNAKLRENYDETIEKYEESQQKLEKEKETFDKLSDSVDEYIELTQGIDDAVQFNAEQRQKALEIQQQITEAVGEEAANLDLVNGSIESSIEALLKLKKEKAADAMQSAADNYIQSKAVADNAYHESLANIGGWDVFGGKKKYSITFERGKDKSKYADEVYNYINDNLNSLKIKSDTTLGDKYYGVKYNKDASAQDIINDINSLLDYMKNNGYEMDSADIYSQFVDVRNAYQADIDEQNTSLRQLLTETTNSMGWENYETIDSLDAYNTLRDKMIEAVKNAEYITSALEDEVLNNNDVTTAVDNWLSGVYQDWYNTANKVAYAYYVASMSIKDILDEIEDEYDALSDALDEMKELGALSSSTIKSLIEDFPELWDYLEETGAILQDEDGYKLSEDALDKYLDKIREEYDDALKSATEYKEALEKAGATEDEIAAAEKYIKNAEDNIKNLEATINVLEKSSLLEDYKEYLESISDGLEDQKDKMKDLYDLRKDLLETYKDELDYQDELNKKQKSVADLQTKLALAKLDTSASGQAKVRELEQELADAQEELDEYTLDRAISDLTDMIDNEYDEYNSFIQQQVDVLTEAIDNAATKTTEELRKILSGEEITEHHSGGFVGTAALKDNEEFAKLLNGELVVTSGQMSNFMKNTLPKIAQSGGGNNVVTYAAPLVELHCDNVTQDTLPQLEKLVDKAVKKVKEEIDESLTRKGYKQSADKFTI